ncbi:hypothetical protein JRG66_14045 [Salinimicrobium tongyeongense]|uniref:Copper resistance protein D n=1 Tax=Salinimicrobium tongyeongense TaxID=2809707 RepID=A0ABY6NQ80_9FLAO|nr:hypothetical protein [Salinimicrobium tongyeongense]UZH55065.1 hypothetical protein JRG66_14045 [Salinimicrobium tongyeongense]
MEYLTLARVLHVLAVVVWIGGVAMVTTVIIPAVKRMKSAEEQMETFEKIEGRFSLQAKITTLLTAITGFYMLHLYGWERLLHLQFWWVHAMILVWFIFSVILFILEPFVLHNLFRKYASKDPEKAFKIIHRAHWVLLVLSLITIFGAVAGSHGWYFVQ